MTRDAPGPPPVVVLLGGPSAEHDVSVVSGTAIAAALADEGRPSSQVLIDLDGGWWWLPPTIGARTARRRLRRPGRARARRAADGRRGDRPPRGRPTRAGRGHRSPRAVRRGRDGPGAARGGRPGLHGLGRRGVRARAWTRRSSSGSAGGSACRSSTGARSAAERWAADRARRPRPSSRPSPPGAGDPRLMVKPSRLGSSRRDDPRPRLRPSSTPRSTSRSATTRSPWSRRTWPGARDLEIAVIGNDPARARAVRAGRDRVGPRVLRLRRQVHAGSVRDHDPCRGQRPRARDACASSPATRTGPSARRASRAIDFLVAGEAIYLSEINTIPGFTPISLFPTLPADGGYTFAGVCSRIVELAVERHAARGRSRLTPGGPAAMSVAPVPPGARARRAPVARRARSVRVPRPACRGSAPAPPSRCSLAAAAIYGVGASSAFDLRDVSGRRPDVHRRGSREAAARRRHGQEPVRARDRRRSRRPSRRCRPSIRAGPTSRLPGTLDVTLQERAAGHGLAGRGAPLPRRRDGELFARLGGEPPAGGAGLPVVEDRRAASAGL